MKKVMFRLLFFTLFISFNGISQIIPLGTSWDSLTITTPFNTSLYEGKYGICYYKPIGYNPLTSPILFYVHGIGGNGGSSADLQTIAERQNALIVAPTMHNALIGFPYVGEATYNNTTGCYGRFWQTQVFKDIYRHVLNRESRSSIVSYLTGFSAGGQFVTRYMLIRQFSQDSIPIKMAVSLNPSNYTFMTDTFNSTQMIWATYKCGLDGGEGFQWGCAQTVTLAVKDFICNEHIKQYYNENYGVLCGSADTQTFTSFCPGQGTDRFDRAKKFFAFSQTNAVTRGTTLKWVMDSVVGIGHDQPNMYNTKRNVTDTFTIAERMIFKTPYHTVPQLTPTCFAIGIKEVNSENYNVTLFPNPNNGSFTLKIDNEIKNAELILINLLGQKVFEQKIISGMNMINTKNLSSGLFHYILFRDKQKICNGKLAIE